MADQCREDVLRWARQTEERLAKRAERRGEFTTVSGLPVKWD